MPKFRLRTLFILVAVFAIAIAVVIYFQPKSPIAFTHPMADGYRTYHGYAVGKQVSVEVPDSIGPPWVATEDNPPLSARQAITLAIAKRESMFDATQRHTWVLQHAALYPSDSQNGYWYWLVEFQEEFQHKSNGRPGKLRLVVMMDGTVIEPILKDDEQPADNNSLNRSAVLRAMGWII